MQTQDSPADSTIAVSSLFQNGLKQTFRLQQTIAKSAFLHGFGFWTGEDINVEFRPAAPNSGIVFIRTDLRDEPRIPALAEFREEKPRQTSLVKGNARVDMVEHLLAAVKALRIDNCEIRVDRAEMPGFDGSSIPFFTELEAAITVAQPAIRQVRLVTKAFRVGTPDHCINVLPCRSGQNSFRYSLVVDRDYPLEDQSYDFELSPQSFRDEIMSSRTFITKKEAEYLLAHGLCQRVSPRDVLVLDHGGPVDNAFRFDNECARHKILDMVGDFSLVDCDWIGSFESYRGGHSLNVETVRQLLANTLLLDESFLPAGSDLMQIKHELLDRAA